MARRSLSTAVLLVLGASCGGCFYKAPTFEIVDTAFTERTDDAYVLLFTVEGSNDNIEPLPLSEVRYSLTLGGQRVFTGKRSPQATLPAGGRQTMELPVSVPLEVGPEPIGSADYRIAATVTYQVPGSIAELLFDSKIRRPSVGFAESGTIRFVDQPAEPAPEQAEDAAE